MAPRSLRPQLNQIRAWVRQGRTDAWIAHQLEVSVLAIMGEKVRIGIDAPRSVPVFRKEVYIEIQQDRGSSEDDAEEVDKALEGLKTPPGQ